MGYKILDVKADIHEDIEKYFQLYANGDLVGGIGEVVTALTIKGIQEDMQDIVDDNFEKIER